MNYVVLLKLKLKIYSQKESSRFQRCCYIRICCRRKWN